jgi:hypothetical protein
VDFDLSQAADGMEAAGFSGDKLHVFEEDGNHGETRFLGDIVEARLTRTNANAIAARAFRKNDEVKSGGGAAKALEFADASRIEFAAFEQKANAAAENALDPGGMPDGFVAENEDWVAAGTPAKAAKQNGIKQTDVVADEEVTF